MMSTSTYMYPICQVERVLVVLHPGADVDTGRFEVQLGRADLGADETWSDMKVGLILRSSASPTPLKIS